jgi:glycosyltransferase involved in cell wall biosynthesis
MPSIAVVMPAYNEAARIERTITTIARYWSSGARVEHVVVADDGSTDGTADVALRAAEREGLALEVLRLPHRGKALTVRSAVLDVVGRIKSDYVMMLDADDELRIDQLDRVTWSDDPRTIYIGRRVDEIDGDAGARPTILRRAMSTAMRAASRVLLGIRFPDTQCGFKLFPTAIAADLFAQQRSTGWTFDAEILYIADRVSRLPVREIPVVWRPRGTSHVRASAALLSATGMLGVFGRRVLRRYRPVATHGSLARGPVSRGKTSTSDSPNALVPTKTRP